VLADQIHESPDADFVNVLGNHHSRGRFGLGCYSSLAQQRFSAVRCQYWLGMHELILQEFPRLGIIQDL